MFVNFKTRKLVVNFFAAVALCLIIGTEINSIAHFDILQFVHFGIVESCHHFDIVDILRFWHLDI